MVAEQPVEGSAARPHGDACTARQVVPGDHPAAAFVVAAHEKGGSRSYDRFYPISVAIIGECGRGCPAGLAHSDDLPDGTVMTPQGWVLSF